MMIKRVLLPTIVGLILLLVMSVAYAQQAETTYTILGDREGDFRRGVGIFGQAGVSEDITGTFVLDDNRRWYPIVADLDGDGDNEYVILDGENWKIFEDNDLQQIDALSIDIKPFVGGAERFSNIEAFDIDGDGKVEIIYVQEKAGFLDILEFNGTNFFVQNSLNLSAFGLSGVKDGGLSSVEYNIKCQAANKCMMTYANEDFSGFTPGFTRQKTWFGAFFNSTFAGNEVELQNSGTGFALFCHPNARSMALADYDNDGKDEFISTMVANEDGAGGTDAFYIFWVEILDDNTLERESKFKEDSDFKDPIPFDSNNGNRCDGTNQINPNIANEPTAAVRQPGNFVTNPITFDFDGSSSNGLETMVAFHSEPDGDHYNLMIKSYDGCSSDQGFETSCTISAIDDFPENCNDILNICGTSHFISNLWQTNAFPGNAQVVDVCVSGTTFTTASQEGSIDTICASEQKTESILIFLDTETLIVELDTEDVPFNISVGNWVGTGLSNNFWYSTQHSSETIGGSNLNEVVTPYGVLKIVNGAFGKWQIFFANPEADGVMIPVDGEGQGSEDLLLLTAGNLFYIDDGLANLGAQITEVTFKPCAIDSILKVNTTLEIDVRIVDLNPETLPLDPVTARVSIYNGEVFEQNDLPQEFNNVSSGALLPYSFILNETITNGEVFIEGFDSENPNDIDFQQFALNVQLNGIEFGDTECTVEFEVVAPGEVPEEEEIITEATLTEDATDNAVASGVLTISALLGLGGTTIWLIIMIAISIGIWGGIMQANKSGLMISGSSALGTIALVNVLMIVLGARLGILSVALVVIIVVISVVIIGIFLGRFLTGLQGAGNG